MAPTGQKKARSQPAVASAKSAGQVIYLGPSIPPRIGGPLTRNTIYKLGPDGKIALLPVREMVERYPVLNRLIRPITEAPAFRRNLKAAGSPEGQAVAEFLAALKEG